VLTLRTVSAKLGRRYMFNLLNREKSSHEPSSVIKWPEVIILQYSPQNHVIWKVFFFVVTWLNEPSLCNKSKAFEKVAIAVDQTGEIHFS
jgi:hypothetical protein